MKKTCLILSVISLMLTFIIAEIFSIYHFGSIPTLFTSLYLISIFIILDYILISLSYVIKKLIKKDKISFRKIMGLIFVFVSLLLVLTFVLILNFDWIQWYVNSSPFYFNVIYRSFEFVLPALIIALIGIKLLKKN